MKIHSYVVFICILFLYTYTLYPSVPGGDSGELITAVYAFSVPHPPGYPLYLMLAKLFSWFLVGQMAWRINFFSAFCGALTGGCLCFGIGQWTKNAWAGVLSAGVFCFSSLVWNNAVAAEVFALNNLLLALLFYCSLLFWKNQEIKFIFFAAVIIGLGLSNQHLFIFSAPFFLLPMLWKIRLQWKKTLFLSFVGLVLGLAPYFVLILASHNVSSAQWGDESTFSGFIKHLLRQDYGTFQLGSFKESSSFLFQITKYFEISFMDLSIFGIPLAFYGIYRTLKEEKYFPLGYSSLAAYLFYLIVFHFLANLPIANPLALGVQSRFWQQPNLLICLWIGVGFSHLQEKIKNYAPVIVIFALLLQITVQWHKCNQRNNLVVYHLAHSILTTLPKNAVLITHGDVYRNSIIYLQTCEKIRPDVKVLHVATLTYPWARHLYKQLYPRLPFPEGVNLGKKEDQFQIKILLDTYQGQFSLWNCGGFSDVEDSSYEDTYQLLPNGICSEMILKSTLIDKQKWSNEALLKIKEMDHILFQNSSSSTYPTTSWEFAIGESDKEALWQTACKILVFSSETRDKLLAARAATLFEIILTKLSNPEPLVYKNLGIAYDILGRLKDRNRLWKQYLATASMNDPDFSTISDMVKK